MVRRNESRFTDIFKASAERQGWWSADRIVAAVSGGSDSTALLYFLTHHWDGDVFVVHIDHGIRGETSRRDASFVSNMCASIGVPCDVIPCSVPDQKEKGESMELAARRVRHSSLEDAARKLGAKWIALGHNSDDVVETVLLNLSRGTGAYGLVGIPEIRTPFCRPLINLKRSELREVLVEKGWAWVDDETNDEDLYLRNRVRNEVVPLIESRLNDGFKKHVLSLASEMKGYRSREEEEAESILSLISQKMPFCLYSLRRSLLNKLSPEIISLVLRQMSRNLDIRVLSRRRTLELTKLIKTSSRWRFQWQDDLEMCADSFSLALARRSLFAGPEGGSGVSLSLSLPEREGTLNWLGWTCNWKFKDNKVSSPWFGDQVVSFPVRFSDSLVLDDVQSSGKPIRGKFPWWLKSHIPVLNLNGKPVWSPTMGAWKGTWSFRRNNVKCDGVLEMSFAGPYE